MPAPRFRSTTAVVLLALLWVWGSLALADVATPVQPHIQAPQPQEVDLFRLLLSGSGNTAMLAVLLWSKLSAQDKEIAGLKTLLSSRPCVLPARERDHECEHCRSHGGSE